MDFSFRRSMIAYMHNNVIFEGAPHLIFGIAAFF